MMRIKTHATVKTALSVALLAQAARLAAMAVGLAVMAGWLAATVFPVFASGGGRDAVMADTAPDTAEVMAPEALSARAAILIDADSGRVLFAKNEHERLPMASTTKIMTALVALESGDPARLVTVPKEAVGVEGSSVYLYPDETLTVEQLLYAMMLESANDAAAALAVCVGGTMEAFVGAMNERAAEMGLCDTSFENPHGLDGEAHYTTAADLAALTACAMKNEAFRTIVGTARAVIPLRGDEGTRTLINHNKLLARYEGAIGVKTGYTKKSGRCLVSAAERDGVTLIAVTLAAPDDWQDHTALLDYGFACLRRVTLAEAGELTVTLSVIGGEAPTVTVANPDALAVTLERHGAGKLRVVTELHRFVYAEVRAGDVLGRAVFYQDGEEIGSLPLVACETVGRITYPAGLWERIRSFWNRG